MKVYTDEYTHKLDGTNIHNKKAETLKKCLDAD